MLTRSQTKLSEKNVTIDFDGASQAWLANKIKLGNGTYQYTKNAFATETNKSSASSRWRNVLRSSHVPVSSR